MLPPEPAVLTGRLAFADAQVAMIGASMPVGILAVSWYGTDVSDERGCFGLVNPGGSLFSRVGDFMMLKVGQRSVIVYIIGSYSGLSTDIAVTRRCYMAISDLAVEPVDAIVSVLS
jgi:hypothetical protein